MSDQSGTCYWCGSHHTGKCPMVKRIEYYENGTVKSVEFHAPSPISQPLDVANIKIGSTDA